MPLLGGPDDVFAPRGAARRRVSRLRVWLLGALLGALAALMLLALVAAVATVALPAAARALIVIVGAGIGAFLLARR